LEKVSGGRESVGRARVFQGPEMKQKYAKVSKIMVHEIGILKYNVLYSLRWPAWEKIHMGKETDKPRLMKSQASGLRYGVREPHQSLALWTK